jgi:hypothetical protein
VTDNKYIRGYRVNELAFYFTYSVDIREIYIESTERKDDLGNSYYNERLKGKASIPKTSILGRYKNQSTSEVSIQIFDYDNESIGSSMYSDWKLECESIKQLTNETSDLNYESLISSQQNFGYAKLKVCGQDDGFLHLALDGQTCLKIYSLVKEKTLATIKLSITFYEIFSFVDSGEDKFIINTKEFRDGETVGAISGIEISSKPITLD